ncbi:MAG: F0F1 ATP synthase subunit alpha [Azospirillum sp.]|nr:F0F1 ATP synthase subunit alpha [Azospirillum sp.]
MSTLSKQPGSRLAQSVAARLDEARTRLLATTPGAVISEIGTVERVGDGVATLLGLEGARLDEILLFEGDVRGMAVSLDRDSVGAVLLDPDAGISAGAMVRGSGEVVRVPVGPGLLGRVVDPLGRPLDDGPAIAAVRHDPIERPAPGITDRELVTQSLLTGVLAVDALIPIGRGQRELIVGDRSTGKTAIGIDAILNQKRSDVVCVYCAIGQKSSAVARVIDTVRRLGPFERTIFVVANADDPPGLQWIAPYAACTIAEYFRDTGGHALLVTDDLTKHAAVHRQVSLLLRYPPGREAYPGDVFFIHSRLLERAAKLNDALGGGSLTALPIAETQAGNISAYIPTNLISITDGQIILEPKLFNEGWKPAVNVGKSVSRVGGKTQFKAIKEVAGTLKLEYAQFLELEVFTKFGQMVDARAQATIEHGRRIRSVLGQVNAAPLSLATQVALLLALKERLLAALAVEQVIQFKDGLGDALMAEQRGLAERIDSSGLVADEDREKLLDWLKARAERLRRQGALPPSPPDQGPAAPGPR